MERFSMGVARGILNRCLGYVRVPRRDLMGLEDVPDVKGWQTNRKAPVIAPQQQAQTNEESIHEACQGAPQEVLHEAIQGAAQEVAPEELSSSPEFTFTCFEKLAPELRCHIYKHALPGPRVVKYKTRGRRALLTPLLLVCHESREEVLRHYMSITEFGPKVYMNPEIDILFINTLRFFTDKILFGVDPILLNRLRRIAYPLKKLEDLIQWPNYIVRERDPSRPRFFTMHAASHFIEHLLDFKALNTLTLVDTVVEKDQVNSTFVDLFTKPISEWPIRVAGALYTEEERRALSTAAFLSWAGTSYFLEELQKASKDTKKALAEILLPTDHTFEVDIKGLIEPASI
ncbi:uncharacterized protein LY89DRAFT_778733 [Mollisia scopiformis]|uniref:2EXR domain-containing protein n=1 Tax=Mollisia scopiformis TaxID=149040 RepID=A0A194XM04_MOLSC|nr:uncharacterized protein LY89DRAFT_778733 [Mollisia scopiformis]KUJ21114.1 hypothetical protein LY89DRAFT_778733 [Mollisia scopiformis]